jgi:hypothetical protein
MPYMYKICIKGVYLYNKTNNMNRLKTLQEKRQEQYKAESLSGKWFWYIMGGALLLTALIENI